MIGQQRIFSPPRHLVKPPTFSRSVLLCLKFEFRFFFLRWLTVRYYHLKKRDEHCIDIIIKSFKKRLKVTIVRLYVVISGSRCPYIDTDGIIQQYISHSVVCTIHTGPGITCCVSGNLDVISRIVQWLPWKYHISQDKLCRYL